MSAALIVVDVQLDFCEGGSLAVEGGSAAAERIAEFVGGHGAGYALVVATRDWHPAGLTPHFAASPATPDYVDTWPQHCVEDTPGASFHPAIAQLSFDAVFSKGRSSAAYSGFEGCDEQGTSLAALLLSKGIASVDICGIATSHCVKATALDALAAGLGTRVLRNLSVGVTDELAAAALDELRMAGASTIDLEQAQ